MAALPDLFHLPKTRAEAFSDGVIAIIITVLVLELKIPKFEGPDLDRQLREAFAHDWPLLAAYVVTFLVLLIFWVAHYHLFHSLRRVSRELLWFNGVFLLLLALVPVPTALIGEYPTTSSACALYGLVLALTGAAFSAMRIYVTLNGDLLNAEIEKQIALKAIFRGLLSPTLYGAGALLSFMDTRLAWGIYILVPLIYFLPSSFDRSTHRISDSHQN